MSKMFSEWMAKRSAFADSVSDKGKMPTIEETQAIAETLITGDTLMIAYELDRLCDILERKGR